MTNTVFKQPEDQFLGILTGKRKKVIEEEKRKTLEAQTQSALALQQLTENQRTLDLQEQQIQMQAMIKKYSLIIAGVVIIFTALYFIVK